MGGLKNGRVADINIVCDSTYSMSVKHIDQQRNNYARNDFYSSFAFNKKYMGMAIPLNKDEA